MSLSYKPTAKFLQGVLQETKTLKKLHTQGKFLFTFTFAMKQSLFIHVFRARYT